MENDNKLQLFLKYFTLVFLFFFPLSGTVFMHNNITNLVIVIVISVIFLLTLIAYKDSRIKVKYLFAYFSICLIYLVISYFKSKSFISLVPNEYSLFNETLTIVKLIMPITFLFSLYYQKISLKEYFLIVKSWIIIIAGTIIITSLFKIGYSTYGSELIKENIFAWSKDSYYIDTACKGIFMYANQTSVILLLLLIVMSYRVLTDKKINIIYICILTISMLILGTRVSSVGGLLSLIFILLFYLIIKIIKKEKINKNIFLFIIPLIFWGMILPISPFMNRNNEMNRDQEEVLEKNQSSVLDITSEDNREDVLNLSEKQQYILDNYNKEYLPPIFFKEFYSFKYDEDFWYNFIKNTPTNQMNFRLIEKCIITRMININNNKMDVLFGISNSRIQNVVNIEQDFVLHYYAYGIVGSLILLFIYLLLMVKTILNFIKKQNYQSFIMVTCVLVFMFSAFLTGNIINSLFPIIIFSFIIGIFFQSENC